MTVQYVIRAEAIYAKTKEVCEKIFQPHIQRHVVNGNMYGYSFKIYCYKVTITPRKAFETVGFFRRKTVPVETEDKQEREVVHVEYEGRVLHINSLDDNYDSTAIAIANEMTDYVEKIVLALNTPRAPSLNAFCDHCGAQIKKTDVKCEYCGALVRERRK